MTEQGSPSQLWLLMTEPLHPNHLIFFSVVTTKSRLFVHITEVNDKKTNCTK